MEAAIRRYLRTDHAQTIAAALTAADAVAADWPTGATTDRSAIVPAYRDRLDQAGALRQFPALLTGAAEVADLALVADPVPAPPYVIVTSTGPVLRATAETGRLVIAIQAFEIKGGDPTTYRRAAADVQSALAVSFYPR